MDVNAAVKRGTRVSPDRVAFEPCRSGAKKDPDLSAARQEAEEALPAAWRLRGTDREGFQWHGEPYRILRAWAALAESEHGERVAAIAPSEAEAYRQLARRLRGELDESPGWAPPAGAVESE